MLTELGNASSVAFCNVVGLKELLVEMESLIQLSELSKLSQRKPYHLKVAEAEEGN